MPQSSMDVAAYFEYGPADRALLAAMRTHLEEHADSLVAAFYRHLLSFEETRRLLRDPTVKERLLVQQRRYLVSLAGPEVDDAYLDSRRRIGAAHERIGLEPGWYLGAYSLYFGLITPIICEACKDDIRRGERTVAALQKLLLLDAHLAMESYIARRERDLEYLYEELSKSGQKLARELEEQSAELRRTAERARAAEQLASIGTLVAGLAHEIGTPMGVIQGHAKLLEPAVADDERATWRLKTIEEQISRISKIIQSLLNMARPTRASRVPVALPPLLENTLGFLSQKLQRRRIQPKCDFAEVPSVVGDSERLQQLFLNLFINAADAMREEGGELHVATRISEDGQDVVVRVRDTGAGIPEPDLPRIFDPFYTSKPSGEGHGLGLSVARGIVSDHGGLIEVHSKPGQGTEFELHFPLPAPDPSAD